MDRIVRRLGLLRPARRLVRKTRAIDSHSEKQRPRCSDRGRLAQPDPCERRGGGYRRSVAPVVPDDIKPGRPQVEGSPPTKLASSALCVNEHRHTGYAYGLRPQAKASPMPETLHRCADEKRSSHGIHIRTATSSRGQLDARGPRVIADSAHTVELHRRKQSGVRGAERQPRGDGGLPGTRT